MTLKAVIIEDEPHSLKLLHNLIEATGKAEIAGETSDPLLATELINQVNPDILFLDIHMPEKDGFDILNELRCLKNVHPYVVFITAYDEFAIRAFEYAAFDYLLKPVEPGRLKDTIKRCIEAGNSGIRQEPGVLLDSIKKLSFRSSSGILFIDPSDIMCVEASGNYSVIHLSDNKKETITMLIGKMHELLREDIFFRISRSYIININYLKKINTRQRQCILSRSGSEIKCEISADRIHELMNKMNCKSG